MADKTQKKEGKGKKKGEFKKNKKYSQKVRKGTAHPLVSVTEQIAEAKDRS